MSAQPLPNRQCPTCKRPRQAEDFYANCTECKECKRSRSKHNRAVQARKLAAFERFVDALITLADQNHEAPTSQARGNAA